MLEQLIGLRKTIYLLDEEFITIYLLDEEFIIKGYNSGRDRWERCIGHSMGKEAWSFRALSRHYFPPISACSPTLKLSKPPRIF